MGKADCAKRIIMHQLSRIKTLDPPTTQHSSTTVDPVLILRSHCILRDDYFGTMASHGIRKLLVLSLKPTKQNQELVSKEEDIMFPNHFRHHHDKEEPNNKRCRKLHLIKSLFLGCQKIETKIWMR